MYDSIMMLIIPKNNDNNDNYHNIDNDDDTSGVGPVISNNLAMSSSVPLSSTSTNADTWSLRVMQSSTIRQSIPL